MQRCWEEGLSEVIYKENVKNGTARDNRLQKNYIEERITHFILEHRAYFYYQT